MKTLLFGRHGDSVYTNVYPDLTSEGERTMAETALEMHTILGNCSEIEIIASPQPRAQGSADIIAREFGYSREVGIEPHIRCNDIFDEQMKVSPWKGYGEGEDLLRSYETHPDFESGEKLERRSEVQRRFAWYLDSLGGNLIRDGLMDVTIHITHFEVLWRLARIISPIGRPLGNGEFIEIKLWSYVPLQVEMNFRDCSVSLTCAKLSHILNQP
ncbi:MAG: histidine phosphatase family protein [Candidatus Taylorbacteria bacterium]|nr:histidine phosphatase family protein [Candidatus Taylorbacteria bacterium]